MKTHKELLIEKRKQMKGYEYEQEKKLKRKLDKAKRDSRKHRYEEWIEREE